MDEIIQNIAGYKKYRNDNNMFPLALVILMRFIKTKKKNYDDNIVLSKIGRQRFECKVFGTR